MYEIDFDSGAPWGAAPPPTHPNIDCLSVEIGSVSTQKEKKIARYASNVAQNVIFWGRNLFKEQMYLK